MKKCLLLCALVLILINCYAKDNYNVLDYGAKNDGKTLTTAQIQKTIDICAASGGGMVYIPKGDYLVGTINLKSNINFHMETGARLVATLDLNQYQKHNQELAGVFYTEQAHDVGITGNGIVFGQGMKMMYIDSAKVIGDKSDTRQKNNFRKMTSGKNGDGPFYPKDRFHQMVIFSECTKVTLRDFTCIDAPYWTFLIVHSDDIVVDGLRIDNNLNIPNSDGLDVISSSNVNISNCYFSCGDDAIVLAGYAWHWGDPGFKRILRRSENINVNNCILRSRSSGIRIGGWDQNDMYNYNFNNITIFDSNRGINMGVGDYGSMENINFTNIHIETRLHTGDWWGEGDPIKITAMRGVPKGKVGTIKNVNFTNVSCRSENCINIYASKESHLTNIFFTNLQMEFVKSALEETVGGNLDLRPNTVPHMEIFARNIPAVYVENASNVFFNQVDISWDKNIDKKHYTNGIEAVDVDNLRLTCFKASASPANPGMEDVLLNNCKDFYTDSKLTVKKIANEK